MSEMNKQELITMLKGENILEDIENGPTSVFLSNGKKNFLLQVKQVDNYIEVTTEKILKHKIRSPINDIEK